MLPVYETVNVGWDFSWTAETKSLADELAEDEERRKADMKDGEEDEGGEGEDEDEGDAEGDDEDSGGDRDGEDEAEEESNHISSSEPQDTIEAEVSESSVKVCYRFRKTTRGAKAHPRHWELVEVWV